MNRGCRVEGCDRNHSARGWCAMHYMRWNRYGDPLLKLPVGTLRGSTKGGKTLAERLEAKVVRNDEGCWGWRGATTKDGYPQFWAGRYVDGKRRPSYAHRVAYELWVGPIPEGYEVDHTCRNVRCLRPDHLEAVTPEVNRARRDEAAVPKTHCVNGHPFDEANTRIYVFNGKFKQRFCRACERGRSRQRKLQHV